MKLTKMGGVVSMLVDMVRHDKSGVHDIIDAVEDAVVDAVHDVADCAEEAVDNL